LMDTVSSNNFMMFEIHKIRYYLVLGKFSEALQQINHLTEISNTFDNLHRYYWYKFKGNYHSTNGDFNQAMKLYELAEDKLKKLICTILCQSPIANSTIRWSRLIMRSGRFIFFKRNTIFFAVRNVMLYLAFHFVAYKCTIKQ